MQVHARSTRFSPTGLSPAVLSAGFAIFATYVFSLPLQVAVYHQLGLTNVEAASWLFITWLTTGVVSVAVALHYRQPLSINLTIPGLLYLGSLFGQFTLPEMVGANLTAGVIIIAIGRLGLSAKLTRWLPLPIVMGMFAGVLLGSVTRLVDATASDFWIAGPAAAGYLVARAIDNPRVPPIGLAALAGIAAALLAGETSSAGAPLGPLDLAVPGVDFSAQALFAITIPMVLLTVAAGNVQGFAYLKSQGYRVNVTAVTVITGLTTVINSLFGGHPAAVGQIAVAYAAGPEAGPAEHRYWAIVLPSIGAILIAFLAGTAIALASAMPASFVLTIGGLAMLPIVQKALGAAFRSELRFGPTVAFVVAATPFAVAGLSAGLLALVFGIAASAAGEHKVLLAHWRASD